MKYIDDIMLTMLVLHKIWESCSCLEHSGSDLLNFNPELDPDRVADLDRGPT
jgi:hypothetical protein